MRDKTYAATLSFLGVLTLFFLILVNTPLVLSDPPTPVGLLPLQERNKVVPHDYGDHFWIPPYHDIPNFCHHYTKYAKKNGPWTDPETWEPEGVPGLEDRVVIPEGVGVHMDDPDGQAGKILIEPWALLYFWPGEDQYVKLTVETIFVHENGALVAGVMQDPIPDHSKVEIIIRETPMDTKEDPEQYGHGILVFGYIFMHGSTKESFLRTSTALQEKGEPRAGDTVLRLEAPAKGWKAGDKLYIPDTRRLQHDEMPPHYERRWEEAQIAAVSADEQEITLSRPLEFDHFGVRGPDGQIEFMPHILNMTRNVVVRSENARGTRGIVMFCRRAYADVRYVDFKGLGRTTKDPFDNTRYNDEGDVIYVGTNQEDRTPVSFSHVIGPEGIPSSGYQSVFVGNTIICPLDPMYFIWGLTLIDTHYVLIKGNNIVNWAGAGFVTKTGVESYNRIEKNYVTRIRGHGHRPHAGGDSNIHAKAGDGYWFRGPNNYVIGNVVNNVLPEGDVYSYGINLWFQYLGPMRIPAWQGADPNEEGEYRIIHGTKTPLLEFRDNEAFGAINIGLTVWWMGTVDVNAHEDAEESVIRNQKVLHYHGLANFNYETNRGLYDHWVIRGDTLNFDLRTAPRGFGYGDYFTSEHNIKSADVAFVTTGAEISPATGKWDTDHTCVVQGGLFQKMGAGIGKDWHETSNPDARSLYPRQTIASGVRFRDVSTDYSLLYAPEDRMGYASINLVLPDVMKAYNHQGDPKDHFQPFMEQQEEDYPVPQTRWRDEQQTIAQLWASPDEGLTNRENLELHGKCIDGAMVPKNAVDRPGVTQWKVAAFTEDEPPVISDIRVSEIKGQTAVVRTWLDLNDRGDITVEYGENDRYGLSVSDDTLRRYHKVVLKNLTPETEYHFRVKSKAPGGGEAVSKDFVFETEINDPPVCYDRSEWTYSARPVEIVPVGSDPDEDELTFSIVDPPSHGNASFQEDDMGRTVCIYTPQSDFQGEDAFTYKAFDGVSDSGPAAIQVMVFPTGEKSENGSDAVRMDPGPVLLHKIHACKDQKLRLK